MPIEGELWVPTLGSSHSWVNYCTSSSEHVYRVFEILHVYSLIGSSRSLLSIIIASAWALRGRNLGKQEYLLGHVYSSTGSSRFLTPIILAHLPGLGGRTLWENWVFEVSMIVVGLVGFVKEF